MDTKELLTQDIRTMTFMDKTRQLDVNLIDALTLKHNRVAGINEVDTLKDRMHQCIHWSTLCATPLTARHLNRLYGRVASRLKVSVSDLLLDFIVNGLVVTFDSKDRTDQRVSYVCKVVWDEVDNYFKSMGELDGMPKDALERWQSNIK
jgi:hypothetical protein